MNLAPVAFRLALLLPLALARTALAVPEPLATFPTATLVRMASAARGADLALLEARADGRVKQITTFALAAASPEVTREVVARPDRYGEFVRNMEESRVTANPDGSLVHSYRISYRVQSLIGAHRYVALPPPAPGLPPALDLAETDPASRRHFRWEFIPALGGTLIVVYGFVPIPDDGIVGRLIRAAPTLEHGLGLMTQMTLLQAMRLRAEQLSPGVVLQRPPAGSPAASLGPLLERGTVAVLRSQGGHLSDISLTRRTVAPVEAVRRSVLGAARWPGAVPTIARVEEVGPREGVPAMVMEQAIPLIAFRSTWGMLSAPATVDLMALEGDLRGARLRFDLRSLPAKGRGAEPEAAPATGGADGPAALAGEPATDPTGEPTTEVVLRSRMHYEQASIVLRQLYKLEPLFELGVNVGLNLVILDGVVRLAEQAHARRVATRGAAAGSEPPRAAPVGP